jgi:hypothetical protein
MSTRRRVVECQRRLLILWATVGGLAALTLLIQTSPGGAYEAQAAEAWDWFLPTVIPAISLMIGSVAAEAANAESEATVDGFVYRIAFVASLVYLALVFTLLLMYAQSPNAITNLKRSGKLVTALYALVGAALGALFVSRKSAKKEA